MYFISYTRCITLWTDKAILNSNIYSNQHLYFSSTYILIKVKTVLYTLIFSVTECIHFVNSDMKNVAAALKPG